VASGPTIDEVEATMREAVEFHIDTLKESGVEVPRPKAYVTYVEVVA